jgi:hypothetical protein
MEVLSSSNFFLISRTLEHRCVCKVLQKPTVRKAWLIVIYDLTSWPCLSSCFLLAISLTWPDKRITALEAHVSGHCLRFIDVFGLCYLIVIFVEDFALGVLPFCYCFALGYFEKRASDLSR